MQLLLVAVTDVLGVIAGNGRLHLPAESPALSARRRDGGPRQRALCGRTSGGAFARHTVTDMRMCRNCLHIAASLVYADDWSEYRITWPTRTTHHKATGLKSRRLDA